MPDATATLERSTHLGPRLRVCLDARLEAGKWGGVEQTIVGLATELSCLGGPERYLFLAGHHSTEWLAPHISGSSEIVRARSNARPMWRRAVDRIVPTTVLDRAYARLPAWFPVSIPTDRALQGHEADVMHFTLQSAFRTDVPSIYVPQDLQHLYLPDLFSARELKWRGLAYPFFSRQARYVVAQSRFGKRDLVERLGLPDEKVRVIPWCPAVQTYAEPSERDLSSLRARHALPEAFALFPAQTFRHKNHLALLDALALLRDRHHLRVDVVFTGHRNAFYPVIEARVAALGLGDRTRFLGHVAPAELAALYRLCRLLVFPSRFEGFGMPVLEAFRLGVPVACSDAACLPEVAGDAALLFSPDDPAAMAEALRRLWEDAALREALATKGVERARRYTWRDTALKYRALYRLAGGRALDAEDRRLFEETA
jgi:glycosyltransferase involved in cell wall biosynthesis